MTYEEWSERRDVRRLEQEADTRAFREASCVRLVSELIGAIAENDPAYALDLCRALRGLAFTREDIITARDFVLQDPELRGYHAAIRIHFNCGEMPRA